MKHSNTRTQKQRTGFTIVELLVVIVVIGILASITIVSYMSIQDRAHDVKRKQDLSQIAKMISLYQLDHGPMRTNGEGCGGQNGTSRGWFNRGDGPGTNYPRSVMQCLIDAGITNSAMQDENLSCAINTDCRAYMAYSCVQGGRETTYVYANLQTIPQADANTDGTCAGSIANSYGMDYYVQVN